MQANQYGQHRYTNANTNPDPKPNSNHNPNPNHTQHNCPYSRHFLLLKHHFKKPNNFSTHI